MTSLGKTYERLMKFIRFFVNRAPGVQVTPAGGGRWPWRCALLSSLWYRCTSHTCWGRMMTVTMCFVVVIVIQVYKSHLLGVDGDCDDVLCCCHCDTGVQVTPARSGASSEARGAAESWSSCGEDTLMM